MPSTDVSKFSIHGAWFHLARAEVSTSAVFIWKFPPFRIGLMRTNKRGPARFSGTFFAPRMLM
jgi:hypothetical protein